MKLHYYPETDSLYIALKLAPGVEVREIADGLNADIGADGQWLGWISNMRPSGLTLRR